MSKLLFLIILIFSISTFSQIKNESYEPAINSFPKVQYKQYLEFLGSDLFEGRGTGTKGGNLAAKYLALEFNNLNLKPAGNNDTYYQYIPFHASKPSKLSILKVFSDNDEITLKLNQDYLLYNSGEQTFTPNPLPLVFVGYGIVAPEFDYNDYQSVDVEGKIVVYLEGEPNSIEDGFFDGEKPTIYSYPEAKQRIAISRGASGSIMIPNIVDNKNFNWQKKINEFAFEDIDLAYSVAGNLSILINPASANILFENSSYTLKDILEMHLNSNIRSFNLNTKLSFKGEFIERDFLAQNIIGMIEGNDPELKDTYLIISAHYDHLGIGPVVKGDSIYNGVFDNAMGVAAVLEIAEAFTKLNNSPARSILFILFTGEENGLLGSTYYTNNPVVPLYKTVANINVDGVAAFDKVKSIVGIGSELSTLKDYLKQTADKFNLKITQIPEQFTKLEAFNRSDQITFAQAGIPSMLILEGPDYQNISSEEGINKMINFMENIYHTPFDDLKQLINYDAVIQHMQIIFDVCYRIVNSSETPEWNKGVPYINERLRTQAEKK